MASATYLAYEADQAASQSHSVNDFMDRSSWGTVAGTVGSGALGAASAYAATRRPSAANAGKPASASSAGNSIKFGSDAKSATKLTNQIRQRGWTEDTVRNPVNNPYTTRASTNMATDNSATVFYNQAGAYVIVDDITKAVVQVGDNIDPSAWIPDSNIFNPNRP